MLLKTRILIIIALFFVGCGARKMQPAPIEINHGVAGGERYGKTIYKKAKTTTPKKKKAVIIPDFVIIKKGDTLYSISLKYNIKMGGIMAINGLDHHEKLNIGQKVFLK